MDANVGISIYQFYLALLLFADDMVLFSDNRIGLQSGLDKLLEFEYCNNWGLIVNVEKTKCLVFKKMVEKMHLIDGIIMERKLKLLQLLNILVLYFQIQVNFLKV